MTIDATELARTMSRRIEAVPGVRSAAAPGPALATLVRDVRAVLATRDEGLAAWVDVWPDGVVRVRTVLVVDRGASALRVVPAVRAVVLDTVAEVMPGARTDVTVRVAQIA